MRSVHIDSWDNIQDTLGFDLTALLITGEVEVAKARYKFCECDVNPRDLPKEIVDRFNFIVKVLKYISGSYNDDGMRRWFLRKRVQLNNLRPVDILKGDWKPRDAGPQKVLALAEALSRPQDTT